MWLFVSLGFFGESQRSTFTALGFLPFKPPRAIPHTEYPRAIREAKGIRGFLALPGNPGENQPNSGLAAIAIWLWLALRALRPLILVYNFEERHTPGEAKSCAPQALSPVPLWRPSTALGLLCRDKCLTPRRSVEAKASSRALIFPSNALSCSLLAREAIA